MDAQSPLKVVTCRRCGTSFESARKRLCDTCRALGERETLLHTKSKLKVATPDQRVYAIRSYREVAAILRESGSPISWQRVQEIERKAMNKIRARLTHEVPQAAELIKHHMGLTDARGGGSILPPC